MPRWTEESRQRQRELIRTWQPWQKSTGPRTKHGKRMSSLNNPYSGSDQDETRVILKRGRKYDLKALAQILGYRVKPKL